FGNHRLGLTSGGFAAASLAAGGGAAYVRASLNPARLERAVDATRQPIFNVPLVVLILVAALGLIHAVFAFVLSQEETDVVLRLFAFTPARYSASLPEGVLLGGWAARIWTFVTYAFLHSGLNHLFFNLLWLVAFGTPVARRFGGLRFFAF